MTNKGRLILISGPSGVGKGTICGILLKQCPNIRLSVSATTRTPRDGDVGGETYHFKTVDEFKRMIENDELLEWAVYNNNYYGTPVEPVVKSLQNGVNVLLEIDVQGALDVMHKVPGALSIFIAPPSVEVLHERLIGRGTESGEQIAARIAAADKELQAADKYDFVVVNDVLEKAVGDVKEIIQKGAVL